MATQLRQFLPVGFRFQPTEMEVVDHFLKLRNIGFDVSTVVPDIDDTTLEKDPWKLEAKFKVELSHQGNDKHWWFFTSRARKQRISRQTDSGSWIDTDKGKKITENQTVGIMTPFVFHFRQGKGRGIRYATWKLYEYRLTEDCLDGLTDDCLDGFPLIDGKIMCVLYQLKKDDKAKINADVQVPQINGDEISSLMPPQKRAMVSMELPIIPVDQESIFACLEQQMHPQDRFLSPYRSQGIGIFENVPRLVESFGSDPSTLDLSWGSSSNGSGSSGRVDFNIDTLSNSLGDQNALFEQLPMEMFLRDGDASEFHGVPFYQDVPSSSSSQQSTNLLRNQRAQSARSLSGVVPEEEKKISARPQISSPWSPARSPFIVSSPRGFKELDSPASSAKSFPKVEARAIKDPTAANPERKKNSIVKIEEDEKLALETIEKLRLKTGSITRNQNTMPFPPSTYLFNVVAGLVMAFAICWLMLYL